MKNMCYNSNVNLFFQGDSVMFGKNSEVIVKKKTSFGKVLAILLAIAAVAFVAVKVYRKFFKKQEELDEADELDALPEENEAEEEKEESFEASAEDVIANSEELEEA